MSPDARLRPSRPVIVVALWFGACSSPHISPSGRGGLAARGRS